jgi:hypothetical protein
MQILKFRAWHKENKTMHKVIRIELPLDDAGFKPEDLEVVGNIYENKK